MKRILVLELVLMYLAINTSCFCGNACFAKGEYCGIWAKDVECARKKNIVNVDENTKIKTGGDFNIVAPATAFNNADLFAGENGRLESKDGVNFVAVKKGKACAGKHCAHHCIQKDGKVYLVEEEVI